MAAVPNPTHPTATRFGVKTALLYGVFVTEKSYLIGVRKLIKREHTKMLVSKVCEDRLPQEIIDNIEEALYNMEKDAIDSAWKSEHLFSCNAHMFERITTSSSPAADGVKAKLASIPVRHGLIHNSYPLHGGEDEHSEPYRHLCASELPTIDMMLPTDADHSWDQTSSPPQLWTSYQPENGLATVNSWKHGRHVLSGDYLTYTPYHRRSKRAPPPEPVAVINRVLRCEGIITSVVGWNSDALREFVDLLELEPENGPGEDSLRPEFHITQTVTYDTEDEEYYPNLRSQWLAGARRIAKGMGESLKAKLVKFGQQIRGW